MGGFPATPELTRDGACVSYVIGRRMDHVDAIGRVIKETEKGGIGFVQTSETVLLESDGRLPIDTHTPASIAPPLPPPRVALFAGRSSPGARAVEYLRNRLMEKGRPKVPSIPILNSLRSANAVLH